MHSQVLRGLADVIARSLSVIFERLWQLGEVPNDWRKANATSVFKKGDPGNYRPVGLTLIPGKVMEQHPESCFQAYGGQNGDLE